MIYLTSPKWDRFQEVILTNICLSPFDSNNKLRVKKAKIRKKGHVWVMGGRGFASLGLRACLWTRTALTGGKWDVASLKKREALLWDLGAFWRAYDSTRQHLLDWWERKQTVFENLVPKIKRASSSPGGWGDRGREAWSLDLPQIERHHDTGRTQRNFRALV